MFNLKVAMVAMAVGASLMLSGCASTAGSRTCPTKNCNPVGGPSNATRGLLGGAVLGGVAGAAIGSGTGAVVAGSAVGAGGGYLLGSHADNGYVNTAPVSYTQRTTYMNTAPVCNTYTTAVAPVEAYPIPERVMQRVETRTERRTSNGYYQ